MTVTLYHYMLLSCLVFSIGICGFLFNTHNVIMMLMCVEIILLAVHINLLAYSHFSSDIVGQVFVIFILTTAAAEAAIALAILVMYYRGRKTIDVSASPLLKG